MKVHFDFTLDEFQAEALCDCINTTIEILMERKLDAIACVPSDAQAARINAIDRNILFHKELLNKVAKSSKRI